MEEATDYTQHENMANAAIHISVMAQDMGWPKDELLDAVAYAYDQVEKVENKELFIQVLKKNAIEKVLQGRSK